MDSDRSTNQDLNVSEDFLKGKLRLVELCNVSWKKSMLELGYIGLQHFIKKSWVSGKNLVLSNISYF